MMELALCTFEVDVEFGAAGHVERRLKMCWEFG